MSVQTEDEKPLGERLREFFDKDAMLERLTHPDYSVIVLFAGLILGFGFFIWLESIVLENMFARVEKPWWHYALILILLGVVVLFLWVAFVQVKSWLIQYRDSMDMQEIEPIYPNPDFVELIGDEENSNSPKSKIDPLAVQEKRWHGVDEQFDIPLTDEEMDKLLQVADDQKSKDEQASIEDKVSATKKTTTTSITSGNKWYLTFYKYVTPISYRVKNVGRTKDRKPLHKNHHDKEIYLALPAPSKEALRYGRMRIPNGGMGVPHGHAAKIKIRYVRLMGGACGQRPLYVVTSCAFFDALDHRKIEDRIRFDQVDILETSNRALKHATKRELLKMESDQQALMDIQSATKEDVNLRKKNVIQSIANKAVVEKEFDDARGRHKMRFLPKREDVPVYAFVTVLGYVLALILLFMLFQKM